MKAKLIKWKEKRSLNCWEGTVKGDTKPSIFIEGGLYVTDLRENRKSDEWVAPKSYKTIGLTLEERKQLAEDLVTGDNFDKHEQNRLEWEAEHEKTAKLIQEVDKLLKSLK